jgi:hypothetical protein
MEDLNFNLFDTFFNDKELKQEFKCCTDPYYNYDNGVQCCTNCGSINSNVENYCFNPYNDHTTLIIKYPYKRVVYFKQKLDLITANTKYKLAPKLVYFIECNKNKKIKSIYKLRKAMKHSGLNKYYKYIYSIYEAIMYDKLIDIKRKDYDKYVAQFKKIEDIFTKKSVRHNLYSYNVIIYFLLRLNNNDGYKHLHLPLNKVKLKKKIRSLISLCENHSA